MRVYPRVGGETSDTTGTTNSIGGLSPRGRGNPQARVAEGHRKGSIPAWAGKPATAAPGCGSPLVYPRVGGETGYGSAGLRLAVGLSPRGRGNRKCRYERQDDDGSIPAWAGKPGTPIRRRENGRVYPRVGGETRTIWPFSAYIAGLSPRGRGNLSVLMRMVVVSRSIPAWAGKPRCSIRIGCRLKVYPRVGGETPSAIP